MTALTQEQKKLQKQAEKERKMAEKEAKKQEKERLQKEKKDQKEREAKEKKEKKALKKLQKQADDDTSVSSEGSSRRNIFGYEKKKPRAEYQTEIDQLRAELEACKADLQKSNHALATKDQKLNKLQVWARSAPVF